MKNMECGKSSDRAGRACERSEKPTEVRGTGDNALEAQEI